MGPSTNSHFIYIDSEKELLPLVGRMEAAGRLTIDTEADSLHSYYEKVCLIQLAIDGEVFLVDPLAGADF